MMTRRVERLVLLLGLFAVAPCPLTDAHENPCASCHPAEVEGYSHSAMAHALRRAGRLDKAASHLERADQMDPLLLPTVGALMEVYGQMGEMEKAEALSERVRQALGSAAPREPVGQRR